VQKDALDYYPWQDKPETYDKKAFEKLRYEELKAKIIEMLDHLRRVDPRYSGMEYNEMANVSGKENFAYQLSLAMRGLPGGRYYKYLSTTVTDVTKVLRDLGRSLRRKEDVVKEEHQKALEEWKNRPWQERGLKTKQAFNDMIGKGWDSAKQYSFCIQESSGGNPQFWWVPQVLRRFPHPPEYDAVVRNPDGTYKSFPKGKSGKQAATNLQIIRLANILYKKGFKEESNKLMGLITND